MAPSGSGVNRHSSCRLEVAPSSSRVLVQFGQPIMWKIRHSRDEAQVNQVGCLNFVTNAVVLWTTIYMQAITKQLRQEGYPIHEDDLRHLSPARYEHINPYGNYEFNVGVEFNREKLRPLRAG